MNTVLRSYGWKRQKADPRDKIYSAPRGLVGLPPKTNNAAILAGVPHLDQGQRSCCTAAAISRAAQFDQIVQKDPRFVPSMEFLYFTTRALENATEQDDGAEPRDAIKAFNEFGVCPEPLWPFSEAIGAKPSEAAYASAMNCRSLDYQAIQDGNLNDMKAALAAGEPFTMGIEVYPSFESDEVAASGIVPMPGADEQSIGGHYIFVLDFDEDKQAFICENSWGDDWGQGGNFELPYAYAQNPELASDIWVVKSILDEETGSAKEQGGFLAEILHKAEEWIGIESKPSPVAAIQQPKDGSRPRF